MRRQDPYSDVTWDENGVLNNSILDDDYANDSDLNNESREEDEQFFGENEVEDDNNDTSGSSPKRKFDSMFSWFKGPWRRNDGKERSNGKDEAEESWNQRDRLIYLNKLIAISIVGITFLNASTKIYQKYSGAGSRPAYVFEHPYISSSYYTSTKSISTLRQVEKYQVQPKKDQLAGKKADGEKDFTRQTKTRLAILRPFCAFDAGPLPTTFDCWQNFPPCRASAYELGEELDPSWYDEERRFDDVGSHMQRDAKAGKL